MVWYTTSYLRSGVVHSCRRCLFVRSGESGVEFSSTTLATCCLLVPSVAGVDVPPLTAREVFLKAYTGMVVVGFDAEQTNIVVCDEEAEGQEETTDFLSAPCVKLVVTLLTDGCSACTGCGL